MTKKMHELDAALKVLEKAAKESKDELLKELGGYRHISKLFSNKSEEVVREITKGVKKSCKNLDKKVRANPLAYLAVAAAAAFLAGHFMSRKR